MMALRRIVRLVKCRWKIEQDYQQLKEELGLTTKSQLASMAPTRDDGHGRTRLSYYGNPAQ
jgi:hypothetical protein